MALECGRIDGGWPRETAPQRTAPLAWADELAELPSPADSPIDSPARERASRRRSLVAVGSGKGGVGKTVVSSSLATCLSESSPAGVLAIDVDLGGANLHNGLGVPRPEFALNRFILEGSPLAELPSPTAIPGLHYIGGASDIVGLSEFSADDRTRFLAELCDLPCDTTVLDLGAGSSLFNLDLFCLVDQAVLVTTPEPTAVQNAYGFLRAATYRSLLLSFHAEQALEEMIRNAMNHRGDDAITIPSLVSEIARYNRKAATSLEELLSGMSVGLVVNMADERRAGEVAGKLTRVVHDYLGVRLDLLGAVSRDDTVPRAICEWRSLLVDYPRARASRNLKAVGERVGARLRSRLEAP